jgi:hypothetical protein
MTALRSRCPGRSKPVTILGTQEVDLARRRFKLVVERAPRTPSSPIGQRVGKLGGFRRKAAFEFSPTWSELPMGQCVEINDNSKIIQIILKF